jgi:hypothetical protein
MSSLSVNELVCDNFACEIERLPCLPNWKLTLTQDRKSGDVIQYIDVKSELLSQVLRKVLRNVRAVSTAEDKPSVS